MTGFVKGLISIADFLDSNGFTSISNEIDALVVESAKIHDVIQEKVNEESTLDEPSPMLQRFLVDFENALSVAQRNEKSKIDYEVAEEVMSIVNNLLNEKTYQTPGTGSQGLSMMYKADSDVIKLVDSIIELEDYLNRQGAYSDKPEEDESIREQYTARLNELYSMINRMRSGSGRQGDFQKYELIRDYYNERRGKNAM